MEKLAVSISTFISYIVDCDQGFLEFCFVFLVGGTYFMIARSLGPAFGAAIGVIFTLANIINVSLNLQGFADIVVGLMNVRIDHPFCFDSSFELQFPQHL